jgi:hypothetical protein
MHYVTRFGDIPGVPLALPISMTRISENLDTHARIMYV